jgi:ketosteroid isomerase-like protein
MHLIRRTVLATLLCVLAHAAIAQQAPTFEQAASATQRVAEPYFAAYIARDWDRLAPLLAESGRFSDPTASSVFGAVRHEGKAAALKNFRDNYAPIVHMAFHRTRAFFSGQHAVFEGTLDWTLSLSAGKQAVTKAMPFVAIVQVVDGLVVDHQDFADYAPFLEAVRKARAGG